MAKMSSFSIKEAVGVGWRKVTSNLKFFILLCLVVLGVTLAAQFFTNILQSIVNGFFGGNDNALVIVVVIVGALVNFLVQLLVGLGVVRVSVNYLEKGSGDIGELFSQVRILLRYIWANILLAVPIIVVGAILGGVAALFLTGVVENVPWAIPFLLLVVFVGFAVWWQVRLQFYVYYMVDHNMRALPSLKKSFAVTDGYFWKLFFLAIVLGLVNILGFFAFILGLFVTVPLSWIAMAYVYKKLDKSSVSA